jgi:uncharacterized membrane protein
MCHCWNIYVECGIDCVEEKYTDNFRRVFTIIIYLLSLVIKYLMKINPEYHICCHSCMCLSIGCLMLPYWLQCYNVSYSRLRGYRVQSQQSLDVITTITLVKFVILKTVIILC